MLTRWKSVTSDTPSHELQDLPTISSHDQAVSVLVLLAVIASIRTRRSCFDLVSSTFALDFERPS